MKQSTIKISENDLRNIIKESVNRLLKENIKNWFEINH